MRSYLNSSYFQCNASLGCLKLGIALNSSSSHKSSLSDHCRSTRLLVLRNQLQWIFYYYFTFFRVAVLECVSGPVGGVRGGEARVVAGDCCTPALHRAAARGVLLTNGPDVPFGINVHWNIIVCKYFVYFLPIAIIKLPCSAPDESSW